MVGQVKLKGRFTGPVSYAFTVLVLATALMTSISCSSVAGSANRVAVHPVEKADAAMGDWRGVRQIRGRGFQPLVAQVIALGGGEYRANLLEQFDARVEPVAVLEGRTGGDGVEFAGSGGDGTEWQGVISDGEFAGTFKGGRNGRFSMKRVIRLSPTLLAKPPEGAIVLFDGSSLEKWKHVGMMPGLINLGGILGGTDRVAYLRTEIWSPEEQMAVLEVGSDDGVKVWLNGEVVHANNAMRGVQPGQDRVDVTLRRGWNELMLKVTQGGGGWGACVRPVDSEGKPLQDVKERDPATGEPTQKYLERNEGYLTVWRVSGPYQQEGQGPGELFDAAFAPEKGDVEADWRKIPKEQVDAETVRWRLVDNRAMEIRPHTGSIITRRKFSHFKLHLEFRTPFMPDARGQGRGNSGVYLLGRYEVQVLDSYGLEGEDNECGGIYKVARPRVNMCAPPMQWQSYDMTFHAPQFDGGRKTANARLTVVHNGVIIHRDLEVPGPTFGGASTDEVKQGGILLQDHGNPVQYRNIWLTELRAGESE